MPQLSDKYLRAIQSTFGAMLNLAGTEEIDICARDNGIVTVYVEGEIWACHICPHSVSRKLYTFETGDPDRAIVVEVE
jgi:hypothetical protein